MFCQTYARMYVMSRYVHEVANFAPLYIHSIHFIRARRLIEAQAFCRQYTGLSDIVSLPDRLRWCRHQAGLTQREVAERIGVNRSVYVNLETGAVDHCSAEIADKLSALYNIRVEDLLDEYNLFLYRGQEEQIQTYMEQFGMGRKKFAKTLGICDSSVRAWESGQVRVSRESWEKYFRGKT